MSAGYSMTDWMGRLVGRVLMGLTLACLAAGAAPPPAAGQDTGGRIMLAQSDARAKQKILALAEYASNKATLKFRDGDYQAAAELLELAAFLGGKVDEEIAAGYMHLAAIAYHAQGVTTGDIQSLEKGMAICRKLLVKTDRQQNSQRWGLLQSSMGDGFRASGMLTDDPERLKQAVRAYRAALEALSSMAKTAEWAMIQNNLGETLQTLGEQGAGIQWLEQAVEAYKQALMVWTRENKLLEWAMTQNRMGNALRELGRRKSAPTLVRQAVNAQESALEVVRQSGQGRYVRVLSADLGKSRKTLADLRARGK